MIKKLSQKIAAIFLTLAMVLSLMPAVTLTAKAAAGDTWATQISGVDANFKGVCYGGSTFVAVGAGGTILTSSNGTSWTDRTGANSTATSGADLNAVCYGNGMFMAVGAGGLVITSPNGEAWTKRTGASINLVAVAYGNGAFVALGKRMYEEKTTEFPSGGYVFTSTNDGGSWNQTYYNAIFLLSGICYDNTKFVVAGDTDWTKCIILISADGSSWSESNAPDEQGLTSVCYGSGLYVACDIQSSVLTSSNGTAWTNLGWQDSVGYHSFDAVCYGGTTYVAVGSSGILYISTDGTTWSAKASGTPNNLRGICYGNSTFVAVGDSGAIITSVGNTAPTVTTSEGSTSYTEQGTAVAIDGGISISDTDGDADWNGGNLAVQITANNTANDILSLPGSNSGGIWIDGSKQLWNDSTQIGTASALYVSNGNAWTFTFNTNATNALVQDTARAILYSNSSDDPGTSRTVTFTATDKNSSSALNTKTISITPVNDAPTLTATGVSPTFIEDGSASTLFSGTSVSTVESGQTITQLKLTVSNLSDGESEILNIDGTDVALTNGNAGTTAANSMSYSVSTAGSTTTVTILKAGGISTANMQTLVNGITYRNASDTPTTADGRVITLTSIQDSGGTFNGGADTSTLTAFSTVTVAAVNDAPFTRNITSFLQLGASSGAKSADGTYATSQIDNVTLEAWIYLDNISGAHHVFFNGNGGNSGYGIYVGGATVNVLMGSVGWIVCSTGDSYSAANNAVLTAGQWTHIAATRNTSDGGTDGWKIYVNGHRLATQFNSAGGGSGIPNALNSSSYVQIGSSAYDPAGLSVSEARIWNRALTQAEIQANMSGTVAANASGLVGYWKLTDGSGTTATDIQTNKAALNLPITGTITWVSSTAGSTAEDTAISGRLAGGDIETSVTLTYAKATDPAHGTVSVSSNGSYTYTPAANFNGNDSFTFVTNDGSLNSASQTVNITVTAVNDAPVVTTSGGTTAFTEGADTASTPMAVDSEITVTDPDNATLASATVSITGNFQSGQDVLAFSNTSAVTYGNIVGSYDAATGIFTLTSEGATATTAQWKSALRAVTYTNNSDNPNTSTRTISFAANDGTAAGTAAVKNLSVTASNDAPVLTSGTGTPTYTENAAGIAVDNGITISDPDSSTFASATVSITAGFQADKDVLGFENGDAATFGNISVESYSASTGVLTLTSAGATATTAQWQAALGAVKFSSTADAPGTMRTISFKAKDNGNAESAAVTKNITVTPVNDEPDGIALSHTSVSEDAVSGTTIGTLTTTDPDGDVTFTYTIQSVTDKNTNNVSTDTFAISGNELCTNAALSYNTNNSYTVTIRTSDGLLTHDEDFTITVTEVNVAPTDISLTLTAPKIAENTSTGTRIGTLSTTDANTPAPFSYSIIAGDTACFKISGNELQFDTVPDFETKDSYSITIRTTDNGGLTCDKEFTIGISDVNEAPVLTASGGSSPFTEAETGTSAPVVVDGGLTVADVDSGTVLSAVTAAISTNYNSAQDALSFTNDGSTMGDIAASFNPSTGVLTLTSASGTATVTQWQAALRAVMYTNASHNPTTVTRTVTFSVSDGEFSAAATRDVSVTQTNSAPTDVALSMSSVDENSLIGTTVGTFTATDADDDDTVTFSLVSGYGDNASFTIESNALKLALSPDYEVKNSYSIRVRATDIAGATLDEDFTIIIADKNDAPSITSGDPLSFAENGTGTVYDADASDPDAGSTITFSISGTDAGLFDINSSTGILTFNTAPNFESPADSDANNVYDLTITATDNGTVPLTATKTISITVTNVNEAPVITTGAAISVTEGSTTAFTAAGTDPEGRSITWSISGGTDAAKFSIDSNTGVVTFTTAPSYRAPADSDFKNDYVFEITATDGTLSTAKTVTITVTQKDERPSSSAVVEVNGQKQDAGTSSTTTSGGQTVTTIKVDDTKLDKILEDSGEKPTVTLPSAGSDVTVGELNGQTVKNMETKEAMLEIKTETVTYTLPASQINIDAVSGQIGEQVALKDIKVSVKIAEPPADTVKIIEDTANKGNYQLVIKPVEFEITCTSGDKTVEVSKFNGYVERTIAIPDGIDPSKITTGVVLNSDRTFRHVPTEIVVINGKYYAKINSLTNSTYSVIYNPIEFSDVSSHWAKTAINDMGSRMIIAGVGNGYYEPDRSITRAEFAAIVVRALGLAQGTTESGFRDVTLSDWFNGYVETATSYSLITGYDSTSYGPNDTITREQAMTILARAMKLTGLSASLTDSEIAALLANYTDGASVSDYAKTSVAMCLKTGVVTGSSPTTLSPKAYVTRAEVAVMVQRLLEKSGLI